MFHINDQITLITMAELRKDSAKIAKDLKDRTVILTKRGQPVAVLEDFQTYKEKEKLVEEFEDIILGHIAKEREKNSKPSDYISEEIVLKRLGIKL